MTLWLEIQISYVAMIFCALIPFFALTKNPNSWKKHPLLWWYFFIVLYFTIASIIFAKLWINNHLINYILTLFEIILFGNFIIKLINSKKIRIVFQISLVFVALLKITKIIDLIGLIEPIENKYFQLFGNIGFALLIIVLSLIAFIEIMIKEPTKNLLNYSPFYYWSACLIFFGGTFFYNSIIAYLDYINQSAYIPGYILEGINIIFNIILLIGLWKETPKHLK